MNVLLWILQAVLALLYVAGGGYKAFNSDVLANQFIAVSRGGWVAIGVFEMLGAVLLIVPAAVKWHPGLTTLAAAALALETLGLVVLYGSYSLSIAASNPLVFAAPMFLLVAFVALGSYSFSPLG